MKDRKSNYPKEQGIIIATSAAIPGYKLKEYKGLVWASTGKAKFILQDLVALGRMVVGGEITEYWDLLNESRHEIMQQLNHNAKLLGANAIVDVKISTSQVVPGTLEILAYGTAVTVSKGK